MRSSWDYLTVTATLLMPDINANEMYWGDFVGSDEGKFTSEAKMFEQLGAVGWDNYEIVVDRSEKKYYFKRPRW